MNHHLKPSLHEDQSWVHIRGLGQHSHPDEMLRGSKQQLVWMQSDLQQSNACYNTLGLPLRKSNSIAQTTAAVLIKEPYCSSKLTHLQSQLNNQTLSASTPGQVPKIILSSLLWATWQTQMSSQRVKTNHETVRCMPTPETVWTDWLHIITEAQLSCFYRRRLMHTAVFTVWCPLSADTLCFHSSI